MKLPTVKDLPVKEKRVLLRTNYDVPLKKIQNPIRLLADKIQNWVVEDETRIEESLETIKYLLENGAKIIAISHLGRPEGRKVSELSLEPVAKLISNFQFPNSNKIPISNFQTGKFSGWRVSENLILLENLRFWCGEEENNLEFAKELASLADFYVNEAFACSHRKHASIVGVPKFFPPQNRAFGFDFLKEIEVLSRIREKPTRPVVLLLGGTKEDKITYAQKLVTWADWILVGGKLIEYDSIPQIAKHPKILADLIKSGQDITMEAVEKFKEIIFKAKTIVWAGPMGNFYDKRYERGTKEIAQAVVESGAFSVVGGGDTEVALTRFGFDKKISFISSGGGAMLEFLAEGTLPGIEAFKN